MYALYTYSFTQVPVTNFLFLNLTFLYDTEVVSCSSLQLVECKPSKKGTGVKLQGDGERKTLPCWVLTCLPVLHYFLQLGSFRYILKLYSREIKHF